jgi:ribosomal protein S18 acetylase RimI-like enzyme
MELLATTSAIPLPAPRVPVTTRIATLADLRAIDALQKLHHKQLGFFPRAQMEGYLTNQWVLAAEESATGKLIGYCASRDRYQKRDELGAIFQLCVNPNAQRMFIGANLLRAVFERAAYGCKLFCCWCAQDLAANHFWESMGFVPLAFRAGSRGRRRVHIFWQKRIREADTGTPWWYPCKTDAGSIREDRIVFPIPPGMRWDDDMPRVVPEEANPNPGARAVGPALRADPHQDESSKPRANLKQSENPNQSANHKSKIANPHRYAISGSKLHFVTPAPAATAAAALAVVKPKATRAKASRSDPRLIAAARELRDRWLERVNSGEDRPQVTGKYSLNRALSGSPDSRNTALIEAKAA